MMNPIYLFLAEGFEDIEAVAVMDILRRAELPLYLVSVTGQKQVVSSNRLKIEADYLFEEVDFSQATMLILPGGIPGAYNLADYQGGLREVIQAHYDARKPLAAICAAPLVYGRMGLLEGVKATCYPGFEENLKGATCTDALVEQDGLFITGKGPAASFCFAYTLVELLAGKEIADQLRTGMIYTEVEK